MDAFFASVELLAHPEWRGRPLIVGSGPHERGVVSTCSYEARKFGVRSAMPSRTAYQLCPHAIFVAPNMSLYKEVSTKAFEIFGHYSPYVEGVSIDEAFLDISGTIHLFGGARKLGEALRDEIRLGCGVTCSVGIAPNRILAKIGSEENKPDGLTMMPFEPREIARFLAPRPISILWGVGKKTVELLKPYGIATCGQIQSMDLAALARLMGSQTAAMSLKEYSFGRSDDRVYWEPGDEKSVSREHTFEIDEKSREAARVKLLELVAEVGMRFRRETRWAKTARLKLRDAAFKTITRQTTFDRPSRDDFAFRAVALSLFDAVWPESIACKSDGGAVRLIGFGVTNIQNHPENDETLDLFGEAADTTRVKHERLSAAIDSLREQGFLS